MPRIGLQKFLKLLPEDYREPYEKGWIHNYAVEAEDVVKQYKFASTITFSDTTCRDGEQQVGIVFTPEQKVEIVQLLGEVGISLVEIGYPGVSKEEERACKMIAENVPKAICFVMARANKNDIDAALRADAKMLDLFTSCSEFHIREKMGLTREENINKFLELLDYATDHGLMIIFGMEDISRSDIDYYVRIVKAVKEAAGNYWAGTGISDTVGAFTPLTAKWFYRTVQNKLGNIALGMHFHNDHGMATANTLACLEEGAAACQGTILGIGERCGNTPLEEVLVALRTIYGLKLRIKYDKLVELCELVSKYSGIPIPPNKPIVGMNAFRHESGIHAHGVLAHPHIYEMIPHSLLGRKSEFAFGKFSGTAVVLEEVLKPHGITPTKEQLVKIVMKVKELQETRMGKSVEEKEKFINDYYNYIRNMALNLDEVLAIAKEVVGE